MPFNEIKIDDLKLNPFSSFKNDWALIASGNRKSLNTMTVSWGAAGILWNRPVSFVFIRPQRYTFKFFEKNDYYSVCFLEGGYKNILSYCGSKSGRDVDKIKETGLVTLFDKNETPYFDQSRIVFICKKIHGQFIDPSCFIDKTIDSEYKNNDYHKMFVGEIKKCLVKE